MNRESFIRDYWNYYLMLEKKFIVTTSYVALSKDNFSTFSNEYVSLLQLIGSELDVLFKQYCGFCLEENKNISLYAQSILSSYPEIRQQAIEVIGGDIIIQPFNTWDANRAKQSLSWWTAFDEIKHNRIGKTTQASLENVLNILGALYLLEMKYLKNISTENKEPDIPNEESALFTLKEWEFEYMSGGDAFIKFVEMGFDIFDKK